MIGQNNSCQCGYDRDTDDYAANNNQMIPYLLGNCMDIFNGENILKIIMY